MKKITAVLSDPWRGYLQTNHLKGWRDELDWLPRFNLSKVNGNILDISAGTGNEVRQLQRFFHDRHVIATDYSPTALSLLHDIPDLTVMDATFSTLSRSCLLEQNGPYAYIQALYALPYASHTETLSILEKSITALSVGGVIVTHFYHDSYPDCPLTKSRYNDTSIVTLVRTLKSHMQHTHEFHYDVSSFEATPDWHNPRTTYLLIIKKGKPISKKHINL